MSGGQCEVVRAETADLDRFVDRGEHYLASLRRVFDAVAAARSRVVAQMGEAEVPAARAARPLGGVDPLAEQIAEATLGNAFVDEVSRALAAESDDGAVGLVPAFSIDLALTQAGLGVLGRDRSQILDQELVEALAVRHDLRQILATGSDLPGHLQGHQIGLALEEYLNDLNGPEAMAAAEVLIDYGIDLQASLDPDDGDWPGQRTAATMFVTQGLLLYPGDRGELVDDLAERLVPTGDGEALAITLVVDALDLEQANDDLTIFGLSAGPWQRANQSFVRQAMLSELVTASHGADGMISAGGQRLVDDVLDRYPGVVELSGDSWHGIEIDDRYHNTADGRACRTWPGLPLRAVLATALAAPNYGLDDAQYEAALVIEDLDRQLADGAITEAADEVTFERNVLIGILAGGDEDLILLITEALAAGIPAADAVCLANNSSSAGLTDARVRRLRVVYDTTAWGDPVPVDEVDPTAMPPGVAMTLAAELGVLQNVQLARFAEGRPVAATPLDAEQIGLVERYAEVAPWFHHRFAWGWPGGAEAAVDHLRTLDDGELERIFGDVPDGFDELLDELGRPGNQVIWDLMAGASGHDTFLGPNGVYRPAGDRTVVSADPRALLVQLALHREVGPYQELLDADGDGTIHENEVEAWLQAARLDPSIPPALVDRVAIGAKAGIGEDTFGWDELAAIIGVVGLAAAVTASVVFSGGTAVPLWVQGGLVGLAALEGYAAYQAGDNVGAVLAGVGGVADLVAAARLLRLNIHRHHDRLVILAERSELPAIRALANQADELTDAEFARRYRVILDEMGYDEFLDVIRTRSLDDQLEIVRNIERIDLQFTQVGHVDPRVGHAAGRHGPHLSDEAMIGRATAEGFAVSRWQSWDVLNDVVGTARTNVADSTWVLANRGTPGDPIRSRGWAQVDAGRLTVEQILTDSQYRHLLKKEVKVMGSGSSTGTRFFPNGTHVVDDGYLVVMRLTESGNFAVLTAYPTP